MTGLQTVLLVEDEAKIAAVLRDYLVAAGYAVHILANGGVAADYVRDHAPAAVLLDLMLPGKDGLTVCREIRAFSNVPILMVTARVEEIDRLLGLELGADDYICKPFSPREVVARVKVVLRRSHPEPTPGAAAGLELDDARFEAKIRGVTLSLTPVEYRLLRTLAARTGCVFSRQQLIDAAYLDHRVVSDRTVDSHIKNLRRKLTDACPGEEPIASVYGVGYRLEPLEDP
ncbi:response regulator [Tahibacter amnicola]|uniref:Response regulator n=1 Tax=Tahibacter amnicola TaxID=2976241 RepID=A0ABY6BAY1_9GAMM|nr:response regulator [Tahibacter amnicola]UXI67218.1 response regulator [Tahibacter amnicola]